MKHKKKMGRGLEDFSHLFLSSPSEKSERREEKQRDTADKGKSVPSPARTLCIASDKGVLERAFVTIQLALEISGQGKNIVLFDADFCLPRLRMPPNLSIHQISLMNLLYSNSNRTPALRKYRGITLIRIDADISTHRILSAGERGLLQSTFYALEENADVILVVVSPEMRNLMGTFLKVINEVMVIVPQPVVQMINAYGVIKAIYALEGTARVGVLASRINSSAQAEFVFNKMQQVTEKFLHKSLYNYGYLSEEEQSSCSSEQGDLAGSGSPTGQPIPTAVKSVAAALLGNSHTSTYHIASKKNGGFTDSLFNAG
jgi:MinD-like ATPase involved in chromosome partitioning or flagellar assembly